MVIHMAYDLSDHFRAGWDYAATWTPDTLNTVVHVLIDRIAAATDDWDASSGEEWVQFSANGGVILYLRVNFPLAIILSGYEAVLDEIPVVVVSVEDFHQTKFSIDQTVVGVVFAHGVQRAFNPTSFTIQELWRAAT